MQDETIPKTKHKTIALGFKNSSCSLTSLISVFLFYKTHSPNKPLLAKNNVKKHAFYPFFSLSYFIFTSILSTATAFCTILPFYLRACSPIFIGLKTTFSS